MLRHAGNRKPAAPLAAIAGSLLLFVSLATSLSGAPANDDFSNAIPLTGLTNVTIGSAGATAEGGEPAHAGEPARSSVWWRWTAPSNATYSVTTSNSTFDTILAIYTGSSLSNLVTVAANDDTDLGILYGRVFFRAYAGETFHFAVDGADGATGTIQLRIGNIPRTMLPWTAVKTDGSTLYSTNYDGKVIMVDLWETTCAACVQELPDLIDLHNAYSPRGFTLIGLAADHDPQVIDAFFAGRPVPYPIALSNQTAEKALGGLIGMPTKYLVDQDSRLLGYWVNGHTLGFYESIVLPLLRQPAFVRIEIVRSGTDVLISWPGSATEYAVEGSPQLPATEWNMVNGSVQSANGTSVMTIPADTDAQFFRLRKL